MADEKIGKNRPPKAHRFKPGESGNKQGRPKGSKNRNSVILKVLGEVVTADLGGHKKKIPVTEASLIRLVEGIFRLALRGQGVFAFLPELQYGRDGLPVSLEGHRQPARARRLEKLATLTSGPKWRSTFRGWRLAGKGHEFSPFRVSLARRGD